jgi:hypothetical protein
MTGRPTGSLDTQYDPLEIPTDLASVTNFALGTLDCMRTLCAELIGLGVVPSDSFQADFQRLADFWTQKGNAIRSEPAACLVDALKNMERVKREVVADLIDPSLISTNMN